VVEYDDGFQARAAAEVQSLQDGSAVVEMLSDYAVMREQARVCQSQPAAARAVDDHDQF